MKPRLSILIPTRNRLDQLLKTLESLRRQSTEAGVYEVVVVSDGSTDGTKDAISRLAASPEWSGRKLICIEQPWKGAAAARNTALQAASGDIVLFLDDDVVAAPDLVAVHLDTHKRGAANPGLVVLGRLVPEQRPEAAHRQMRLWWLDHFRRLAQAKPSFSAFFTGNVSLPREAALRAGGFDESIDYGEDVEFGYRLSLLGLDFRYQPRAVARNTNLKSGTGLLRDMYRTGQGSVRTYHKFPQTLRSLPLSAYGETNLRMRAARGLLLRAARYSVAKRAIEAAFSVWAEGKKPRPIDRQMFELARSYYYWSGVRTEVESSEWSKLTSAGVPVLLYHSIEPDSGNKTGVRVLDRYTVSSKRFARQMRLLKLLGCKVVSLEKLVDTLAGGELPQPRSVAISFDDGYRNNMVHAWPVLKRLGYPATLFFVSGLSGRTNLWDRDIGCSPKTLLTYEELKKIDAEGFRVEAHTVNHVDLSTVNAQTGETEIRESRRQLESQLERTVQLFAYPYGHFNQEIQEQVVSAGYKAAFSVQRGLNTLRTSPLALRRVAISDDDNLLMFAMKVWTGDDPLRYIPGFRRIIDRKYRNDPYNIQEKGGKE